jgi:transcriptional regulator with XRE-family HTH domain
MMNEAVLVEARNLISGFLKSRREQLGITQQELADMTGMGIATIKRFESGKFWLNMKQFLAICFHLKCFYFLAEVESEDEFAKMMRERWKRPADDN